MQHKKKKTKQMKRQYAKSKTQQMKSIRILLVDGNKTSMQIKEINKFKSRIYTQQNTKPKKKKTNPMHKAN